MRNDNNYKKSATIEELTIGVCRDNSIDVLIDGKPFHGNVKGMLRDEIAPLVGFNVDPVWTTQQLGSKLVDYINDEYQNDGQSHGRFNRGREIQEERGLFGRKHSSDRSQATQHFRVELAIKGANNHEWKPVSGHDVKSAKDNRRFVRDSDSDNYESCLFSDDVQMEISVYDARNKLVFQEIRANIKCLEESELAERKNPEARNLYYECQKLWKKDNQDFSKGCYQLSLHNMKWMGFILTVEDEEFDINKLCFIQAYRCNTCDDPLFTPYRMAYNNQLIQCKEDVEGYDWDEYGTECFLVEKKGDGDYWTTIK